MKCPLCLHDKSTLLYNSTETFTNKDSLEFKLELECCESCNFVFLSSAYSDKYADLINIVYKNFDKSYIFPFPNKNNENIQAIEMISKYIKSNENILEIGSNRGDLLYLLKEKFHKVNILGIEPTENQKVYVPTIKNFFTKKIFSSKFDVIILQHVLEHITNPNNIVEDIYNILEDDAIVYIEVPSLEYSLNHCIEDFMLEHVSYFSKQTLISLFSNFEVLEIEEEPFLRIIFKKSKIKQNITKDKSLDLNKKFKYFNNNRQKLIHNIKDFIKIDNKKIVFFGTSFYFRKIYLDLSSTLLIENAYFMDDNIKEEYEQNFNLKKIDTLTGNEVVILCSNNYAVQKKMLKKINNINGLTIVMPWSNIIIVKD